ncbi:MAG: hypothetical protein FGM41_00825 [Bacteroidetes bacterium]|nr:hypothetical protein [Bacteroidota bacterium]
MKKSLFNILGAAAMLGLTLSSFQGCKLGDPLEGVAITVKADAVSPAHVFKVVDAKTGYSAAAFDNATITISGDGASFLYNEDAKKTFKIVEGRFGVCIRKGFEPSGSKPLVFNLSIAVPGYISKSLTYKLFSTSPTYNEIALVNLSTLPPAAAKKDSTFTVPATGTTQAITLTTDSNNTVPDMARIKIPAGTIFKDENGNTVSGNITVKIIQAIPKTKEDFALALTAPFNTNYVDSNNQPLNVFFNEKQITRIAFESNGKKANPAENPYVEFEMTDDQFVGAQPFAFSGGGGGVGGGGGLGGGGGGQLLGMAVGSGVAAATSDNNENSFGYPCGATNIEHTIENFSTMGQFYEFRTYKASTQQETDIIPNSDGTFTASISIQSIGCDGLVIVQYKKRSATEWISATSTTITLPFESLPQLTVYFRVECSKGDFDNAILPDATAIYLIDNEVYKATPNPARAGALIYPSDDPVGSVKWQRYTVTNSVTRNNKVYNVVKIPKNELTANITYRAAYYRSGARIDNDVDNPNAPALKIVGDLNQINEIEFEMTNVDCR